MAIDEADQSDAGDFSDGEASDPESEEHGSHESDGDADSSGGVRVDEYTWEDFMEEYGYGDEVSVLYPDEPVEPGSDDQLGLETDESPDRTMPTGDDWDQVEFDPEAYLGYHPDEVRTEVRPTAEDNAETLWDVFLEYVDPETTPVVKDEWTWEHYKWEYYYEDDGSRPRDGDGEIVRHDEEEALGFDPDTLEQRLFAGDEMAMELDELVEERTVNVQDDIDEDEFFSTVEGNTTVTNRYDLEKAVPFEKKTHFQEVERYWVNKPYACVVIFHSEKENEKKYYLIEPYLNEIELELEEFLSGKLRKAIKYSDEGVKEKESEDGRRTVIEDETRRLLKRYDLFEKTSGSTQESIIETVRNLLDDEEDDEEDEEDGPSQLEGLSVRPEPAIIADDPDTLSEYQVEKLLYLLKRNFIGYERIDGIKHDINVEDISCDGYNSPVFVYHSEYEQIITNVYHGEDELDDFVVKLAQRSGKGISKRLPQVDATLPDGSRAQLTLGQEVSDHGTNYTIRQFKDVPFTPIDLINWNTFSLDEMAFLWLCIENHKSLIFAGGTASGKTTSLNAVSLFIPSSAKIVSIEDTREVELPQRNWIASVTRPSFADDEQGDVDEFDLLEAALRQRPDYIVMGEIRGEEGRTLFQVMSTGHTTYTTFHADSVDEVLKRFTTDPINVSKTMFTALDLVSIQTQTRVQGRKVRRNKSLTEINHYEAEHDEINVQDVYQWQAETDEFLKMGDSNTLEEIQFDRGWSKEKLEEELFKREVILAYLIKNELNTYAEVAATAQAFINDPDTILTLIANGQLEASLEDLREMESVLIDVDQEKEELVPRPDATTETYNTSMDILERAEESLFEEYRGKVPSGLASALGEVDDDEPIDVDRGDTEEFDFEGEVDDAVDEDEWELGDGETDFDADSDEGASEPAWLSDDTGFEIGGDRGETMDDAQAGQRGGGESSAADGMTADRDRDQEQDREPESASSTTTAIEPPAETASSDEMPDSADAADATGSDSTATAGDQTDTSVGFDMATDTATGDTAAPSTTAGTESNASPADDGDSAVLPTDDAEDGDLGGLFDDMGETIDKIEGGVDATEQADAGSTAGRGTSGFDSMFPEDDLESIFDPEAEGASGDFSDELESTAAPEAAESTKEAGDETSASVESVDDGGNGSVSDAADEEPTAASAEDSESASTPSSEGEPQPPTIDLSEPTAGEADDEDDSDAPIEGEPPADGETGETAGDAAARSEAGETADAVPMESPTGETSEPESDTDESEAETPADGVAKQDPDDTSTASDSAADSESEPASIFGDESDSVFSDDDDDGDGDDGSLFGEGGDTDEAEDSIFKQPDSDDTGDETEAGTGTGTGTDERTDGTDPLDDNEDSDT